jgi:hypothetical protein
LSPTVHPSTSSGRTVGLKTCLSRAASASQSRNFFPVASHHCLLLLSAPTLYLLFACQSLLTSRKFLGKHQSNGEPRRGVTLSFACLMFHDPFLQVVGVACIVGAVTTAQDIYPKAHPYSFLLSYEMRSGCPPFDRLRVNGFLLTVPQEVQRLTPEGIPLSYLLRLSVCPSSFVCPESVPLPFVLSPSIGSGQARRRMR